MSSGLEKNLVNSTRKAIMRLYNNAANSARKPSKDSEKIIENGLFKDMTADLSEIKVNTADTAKAIASINKNDSNVQPSSDRTLKSEGFLADLAKKYSDKIGSQSILAASVLNELYKKLAKNQELTNEKLEAMNDSKTEDELRKHGKKDEAATFRKKSLEAEKLQEKQLQALNKTENEEERILKRIDANINSIQNFLLVKGALDILSGGTATGAAAGAAAGTASSLSKAKKAKTARSIGVKSLGVEAALYGGWEIGSYINEKIEGTEFHNAIGRSVAVLLAPFSSEARESIQQEWKAAVASKEVLSKNVTSLEAVPILDKDGKIIGYSEPVKTNIETVNVDGKWTQVEAVKGGASVQNGMLAATTEAGLAKANQEAAVESSLDVFAKKLGALFGFGAGKITTSATGVNRPNNRNDRLVTNATLDASSATNASFKQVSRGEASIMDFISKADAGPAGYDAIYGGKIANSESYTVDEIMQKQSENIKNRGHSAVGAYQITLKNMKKWKDDGVVKGDEKWTKELQDRLGFYHLAKKQEGGQRAIDDFLLKREAFNSGKIDQTSYQAARDELINIVSKEWAAIPTTDGQSRYKGVSTNNATRTIDEVRSAFDSLPFLTEQQAANIEGAKSSYKSAPAMSYSKMSPSNDTTILSRDSTLHDSVKALRVKLADGTTKTLSELGVEKYSDLEKKAGQAFAGGKNDPVTTYTAGVIQKELGDDLIRVTGQADEYHKLKKPNSAHNKGTKLDFTVKGSYAEKHKELSKILSSRYGMKDGQDFAIISRPHGTEKHIDFELKESGRNKMSAFANAERNGTVDKIIKSADRMKTREPLVLKTSADKAGTAATSVPRQPPAPMAKPGIERKPSYSAEHDVPMIVRDSSSPITRLVDDVFRNTV